MLPGQFDHPARHRPHRARTHAQDHIAIACVVEHGLGHGGDVVHKHRLQLAGPLTFRALIADAESTLVVVARFLALLELFRDRAVAFEQLQPLGDLTVAVNVSDPLAKFTSSVMTTFASPAATGALSAAQWVIWALFALEYLVFLVLSPDRGRGTSRRCRNSPARFTIRLACIRISAHDSLRTRPGDG